MSVFSKILQSTSKNINKALHKEQRGIYNVTYNGKFSTPIKGVNFRVVSGDNSASGKGANSLITSTTSTEDIITLK